MGNGEHVTIATGEMQLLPSSGVCQRMGVGYKVEVIGEYEECFQYQPSKCVPC